MISIGDDAAPALSPEIAAHLAAINCAHTAYAVADLEIAAPTRDCLHWIGLSAGKHYPYTFLVAGDGRILWKGNLPPLAADAIPIIDDPTRNRSIQTPYCPTGGCPLQTAARRILSWPTN